MIVGAVLVLEGWLDVEPNPNRTGDRPGNVILSGCSWLSASEDPDRYLMARVAKDIRSAQSQAEELLKSLWGSIKVDWKRVQRGLASGFVVEGMQRLDPTIQMSVRLAVCSSGQTFPLQLPCRDWGLERPTFCPVADMHLQMDSLLSFRVEKLPPSMLFQ